MQAPHTLIRLPHVKNKIPSMYQCATRCRLDIPLVLRMAIFGILQNLDVRFEDGYAKTWEDDWKDRFVLATGELPVVFSDRV